MPNTAQATPKNAAAAMNPMDRLGCIVVGIDFTACSAAAARQALRIAKWNRSRLHFVHVIDTVVVTEMESVLTAMQVNLREELVREARQEWETFAVGIPGAAEHPIEVTLNNRSYGILHAAKQSGADLIILGAYGTRAPDVGLGTIATSCVRDASRSVLLVREGQEGPYKNIVACVDFSPTSLRALGEAARVAAQDGAALHVISVLADTAHAFPYFTRSASAREAITRIERRTLLDRLHSFALPLKEEMKFLKPSYEVVESRNHASGILDFAGRTKADLVVLGTRGQTSLARLLLGTTAERVLRQSPCSVLAVKPEIVPEPLEEGLANAAMMQMASAKF